MIKSALDINYWIHVLCDRTRTRAIDEPSKAKLLELFAILDVLEPMGDDNRKDLWLSIRRPTLEEYTEYEAWNLDDAMEAVKDKTRDEIAQEWYEESWSEEMAWFSLCTVNHNCGGAFYGLFLGDKYILSIGDPNEAGYPIDVTELIDWMIGEVKGVVEEVEIGNYNERISSSLPAKYRTGTIGRKAFWDLNPELRKRFREGLSDAEISRFVSECDKDIKDDKYLPEMTARRFYEACGVCYDAVPYDNKRHLFYKERVEEKARYGNPECTPKEKYFLHADGRDDKLNTIPMDDPGEFELWRSKKGEYYEMTGSHPWEIRTSGSIEHSIHLFPYKTDGGRWYFLLSGDAASSSYEIVKYFLAMYDAGLPVELQDAKAIAARYTETDKIGILPCTTWAFGRTNMGYYFHDPDVTDVINLDPEEHGDEAAKIVDWISEKELRLKPDNAD